MNVVLSCTNHGDVCLTRATFPGCPWWSKIRCVKCGEPMRLSASGHDVNITEPIWRSFEDGEWRDSTPRPEQLALGI